jgi:hypothetical protein
LPPRFRTSPRASRITPKTSKFTNQRATLDQCPPSNFPNFCVGKKNALSPHSELIDGCNAFVSQCCRCTGFAHKTKVNPDLITRDREGKPYRVRYDAVNAILLNEFLKAHRKNKEQDKRIEELTSRVGSIH